MTVAVLIVGLVILLVIGTGIFLSLKNLAQTLCALAWRLAPPLKPSDPAPAGWLAFEVGERVRIIYEGETNSYRIAQIYAAGTFEIEYVDEGWEEEDEAPDLGRPVEVAA